MENHPVCGVHKTLQSVWQGVPVRQQRSPCLGGQPCWPGHYRQSPAGSWSPGGKGLLSLPTVVVERQLTLPPEGTKSHSPQRALTPNIPLTIQLWNRLKVLPYAVPRDDGDTGMWPWHCCIHMFGGRGRGYGWLACCSIQTLLTLCDFRYEHLNELHGSIGSTRIMPRHNTSAQTHRFSHNSASVEEFFSLCVFLLNSWRTMDCSVTNSCGSVVYFVASFWLTCMCQQVVRLESNKIV